MRTRVLFACLSMLFLGGCVQLAVGIAAPIASQLFVQTGIIAGTCVAGFCEEAETDPELVSCTDHGQVTNSPIADSEPVTQCFEREDGSLGDVDANGTELVEQE